MEDRVREFAAAGMSALQIWKAIAGAVCIARIVEIMEEG